MGATGSRCVVCERRRQFLKPRLNATKGSFMWYVQIPQLLSRACASGDFEFVSQYFADGHDIDTARRVDWEGLMKTAYDNNYMAIVRCIRDSGQVSILYYSCLVGDLEFLSQYLAEERDRGQNVDWDKLMKTAYDNRHRDVVGCIRDSGRGSIDTQLYYSCLLGGLEFVSLCIAEDRDRGQNVEWEGLMKTAYDNKHLDIVRCISDSGRVSILYYSCLVGDLEFLSQCIAEDRDRGQNVDWDKLMSVAYDNKHKEIVGRIRDSGRVSVGRQLDQACDFGDLEFVSKCIAENKDRGQNVEWERLIKAAYDNNDMDLVRRIRNSGRVSVDSQLYYSCLLEDFEFVSQCIREDRDRGQNVDWERLMKTIHGKCMSTAEVIDAERGRCIQADIWKYIFVLRCIRDTERVSLDLQLYYSCFFGDLKFVSQCIAEDRDRGQNVDWDKLMKTAYDNKHRDVVGCIRDSGRGSIDTQLYYSCLLGSLEFVLQCIAEDRNRGQNVDWEMLIDEVRYEKHKDNIVRCIRDSGRVSIHTQLSCSFELRDFEFVLQCIAEDRDRGQNVDWGPLMLMIANDNCLFKAQAIVESGRCTLADLAPLFAIPSEVMEGAYDYNEKLTKFVIKHTADVNREIRPGLNTLHVACYIYATDWRVSANIIKLVWEKGGQVNQEGYMGRTALHFLCHGGNSEVDKILDIQMGNIDESNQHQIKKRKLHVSEQIQHMDTALILDMINRGAEVNATDENGQTPLHLLCLSQEVHKFVDNFEDSDDEFVVHADIKLLESGIKLLERGANINMRDKEGRTPLAVAAQRGNRDAVSFLLKRSCDKNMGNFLGQTPLYLSAVTNSVGSAEILCEEGVNVNQADDYYVTPLAVACENGNHQIVDLLLKHGADLGIADIEERTALHKAALCGSTESCNKLIGANSNLNAQDITGCTALHLVATANKLQIIQFLLDSGCSVNVENNLGNIALHNAVSNSSKEIAEVVIRNRSEVDHKNNYGNSPIVMSASSMNLKMMKFLKEHNATLTTVNNMQRGLIHNVVEDYSHACFPQALKIQRCQAIIEWLIENGLSINATDVNRQTPLHLAAQQEELDLVSFLVSLGSDVTARDSFNHMPLMNALEKPEVFQYLWEKTLPHITEEDFRKLQHLSYWLDISEEIKQQIRNAAPVVISFTNRPQNVRKLKLRYDDNLEKWLKTQSEELPAFMAHWLPSLQLLTYIDHPTLNEVMWQFLNDLQNGVKKVDPLVAYIITRCGSVEEKTKAFAQDECDCSCVQENIRFEMFEAPQAAGHPLWTAFVHLVCKEEYYDQLKRVLDGKKRLSPARLCRYFGKAIGKVLANPEFWEKYSQLQRISATDISAGDRRISTMHVIWSDEICPWLKIDIDLAAVIDLSKWKPTWCRQHPLLGEIECIALPKWKMTHEVNMDLVEIGVHSWGPLFHKMPEEMRQGYRLAKVVRGSAVCPQIPQTPAAEDYPPEAHLLDLVDRPMDPQNNIREHMYEEWSNAGEFMNTYLLKQVIMHEYTAWYDQKVDGLEPPVHTDVYWARRIYEKMEEAFKRQELYSWFIPTYNLLTDDKFKQFQDTAVLYARLCKRLLTEEAAGHFRKAFLGVPDGCQD